MDINVTLLRSFLIQNDIIFLSQQEMWSSWNFWDTEKGHNWLEKNIQIIMIGF